MAQKIFALLFRSLRSDVRSFTIHISWFLLLVSMYVGFRSAEELGVFIGAPGQVFFDNLLYANLIVITLYGIVFYSRTITEEKEDDSLGLLRMSGISSLGLLIGKSTSQLFQTLILLVLQLPLAMLAITLGGVSFEQIVIAYTALAAYTLLLSNIGLFNSVICQRGRDATGLTVLMLMGYVFVPLIAYGYCLSLAMNGQSTSSLYFLVLRWIAQTNIFIEISSVCGTTTSFSVLPVITSINAGWTTKDWTPLLFSHIGGSLLLFLMAWTFIQHSELKQGWKPWRTPQQPAIGKRRSIRLAGRAWNAALIWKDYNFITGGFAGTAIRSLFYLLLFGMILETQFPRSIDGYRPPIDWTEVTRGFQIFVLPTLMVECALYASRFLQEEIQSQTLASLIMLPRSLASIVYSKLGGILVGLLPGTLALLIAYFLLPERDSTHELILADPRYWWMIANLILIPHLAAVASLYSRWGAFLISCLLVIALSLTSLWVLRVAKLEFNETSAGLLTAMVLVLIAGCHAVILLRLPKLAAC